MLRETIKLQNEITKRTDYNVSETKVALAENLIEQKKFREAAGILSATVDELSGAVGAKHPTLVRATKMLKGLNQSVSD